MRIPHLIATGGVWLADDCTVVGRVTLGPDVSVWYSTVIRGDVAAISIGARTNVQDGTVIHPQHDEDVTVGADCVIGHRAIVHCRTVGDRCTIGMGSILLPGSVIGDDCIIGAGALIPIGRVIPPGSLVVGSPGRVVRSVTDAEVAELREGIARYLGLARQHCRTV